MLAMKINCECCDANLPPETPDATICSFECTFCRRCADERLGRRCPNCGGNLVERPKRSEALLARFPAVTERTIRATPCPE